MGKDVLFESWMVLCEKVVDVAEKEALNRLQAQIMELAEQISDEIIERAEEV